MIYVADSIDEFLFLAGILGDKASFANPADEFSAQGGTGGGARIRSCGSHLYLS